MKNNILTKQSSCSKDIDNNKYFELLMELEAEGYYGEVTLKFNNGKIVQMRKTESIKFK